MTPIEALRKAVELAGGQSAFARALGGRVRQGHVWYWLNAEGAQLPAEYCAAAERAPGVDGRVTRRDLRPDIFGAEPRPATPTPIAE